MDTAIENMDPNTLVDITVVSLSSAGKKPKTRWGAVAFDEQGVGAMKVPLRDVKLVDSLGWLSKEDKEKYLGIEEVLPETQQNSELLYKLDAAQAANTRLAQKNAELEAQLDEAAAKYKREFDAYQSQVDEHMLNVTTQLTETSEKLDKLSAIEKENVALKAEVDQLKTALAAASAKKGK